jgi:hypothetical protein
MEPDAIIAVRFKTPEENGRRSPIDGDYYGCPFCVDGEYFDCRLLLAGQQLELGETYEVPVQFLRPDLVLPKLRKEKEFTLWEGKEVATGKVVRVISGVST